MKKEDVISALKSLRTASKKRKFNQTVDFTINFKGLDFKKEDSKIDVEVKFPHSVGRGTGKVIAFVGDKNLAQQLQAANIVDLIIMEEEIPKIDKKKQAELADGYIGSVAEGKTILTVAKYLGQVLASKGKMSKTIGQDVAIIKNVVTQLKSVTKVSNKKGKNMPLVHVTVGKEDMDDDKLSDNILTVYNLVLNALPAKQLNIKSSLVKFSMSTPIKVGEAK
jgi:large subunit ribosomal protein L1